MKELKLYHKHKPGLGLTIYLILSILFAVAFAVKELI
jgi:hypothetical protein